MVGKSNTIVYHLLYLPNSCCVGANQHCFNGLNVFIDCIIQHCYYIEQMFYCQEFYKSYLDFFFKYSLTLISSSEVNMSNTSWGMQFILGLSLI